MCASGITGKKPVGELEDARRRIAELEASEGERVRAEKALREREEQFRTLIDNSLDGIAILNSDHTIRYLSPSAKWVIGYKPEELIGKDPLEFLHPDDTPRITRERNSTAGSSGKPVPIEVRFRHQDGSWCVLEGVSNNLTNDPVINGIVINYRNITDRVQALKKLKDREQQFRALIDNSLDGIAILNSDLAIRYLSPSTESIIGYKPEELNGKNPVEFLHPDDAQGVIGIKDETGKPGQPLTISVNFRHKNGSWCILEGISKNLLNDPTINGIVVNFRDITDRVQAQQAVKEREEHFRALIENSLDGIAVLDKNLVFRYTSPSTEWIIGYKPEELIDKNSLDFIHPDDGANFSGNRNAAVRNPGQPVPVEFRFMHKDGSWYVLEGVANYLVHDPIINGIVVNFRDITERKRAEEARVEILTLQSMALQAQSELDQALAALEHALSPTEPESNVGTNGIEDRPILELLHHAALHGIAPNYANKLLNTLQGTAPQPLLRTEQANGEGSSADSSDEQLPLVLKPLTEREMEVLQLIAAGSSNYEIAQALILAIGTVKKHINNIYSKLGVYKRTLAVTRAQELGLL